MLSGLVLEFTLDGDATLNGAGDVTAADVVRVAEEQFDAQDPVFQLVFDGSDVGLGDDVNVDAFAFLDDGSLLLSFDDTVDLGGGLTVHGEDVVRFSPTSLGANTAGSFSMFLDGSDLSLSGTDGNVDALAVHDDASLLISTAGDTEISAPFDPSDPDGPRRTLTVQDADVVRLERGPNGEFTGSNFSLFALEGTLGLRDPNANIDGLAFENDGIFLSTTGEVDLLGLSVDPADVVQYRPDEGGEGGGGEGGGGEGGGGEEGEGGPVGGAEGEGEGEGEPGGEGEGGGGPELLRSLFFRGDDLSNRNVVGLDVRFLESTPNERPTAGDLSVELDEDGSATVQLLGDDGDAEPTGSMLTYEVVDGPENGTFTLDAATGELVYTPNADFNGSNRLVYRVLETTTDGQVLVSEVATVTFAVAAVNDAPVVTVGETVVGSEDARFALPGVSVSDVEGGDVRVVLRVRNGTLLVSGDAGTTRVRGNGTNRIVLRGSQADVNRLLAGLTYQGRLDFDGNDRLVVRVSDLGNSGSGGRLVARATQDIVVQSPSDQAAALRDRIADLVDDGELRRGHGRVLASLVNFRSESRFSEVRVRVFLRYVDLLERRGRLGSDAAAELRSAGTTLLSGLATTAAPRRFWFLFR